MATAPHKDRPTRKTERARLFTLRQQMDKGAGRRIALADFVAPKGTPDYVGGFAVTAGIGEEEDRPSVSSAPTTTILRSWPKRSAIASPKPSPNSLHAMVRCELWGYESDEKLSNEDLIAEKYRGIRPAPGYPAQPDHTEKSTLFSLLDASAPVTGIELHRKPRDEAGFVSVRLFILPIPKQSISASAELTATKSRTTPSAKPGTWRQPSAGRSRSSPTIRCWRKRADAPA